MGWNHRSINRNSCLHILDMVINKINKRSRHRHSHWNRSRNSYCLIHSCHHWNYSFMVVTNRKHHSCLSYHIPRNCCHSSRSCYRRNLWISLRIICWNMGLDRSYIYHSCTNIILILLYKNHRLSHSMDMVINHSTKRPNSRNHSWNCCCRPNIIHISHNCWNRNHMGFKRFKLRHSYSNSHHLSPNISHYCIQYSHNQLHYISLVKHPQHLRSNSCLISHRDCHRSLQ